MFSTAPIEYRRSPLQFFSSSKDTYTAQQTISLFYEVILSLKGLCNCVQLTINVRALQKGVCIPKGRQAVTSKQCQGCVATETKLLEEEDKEAQRTTASCNRGRSVYAPSVQPYYVCSILLSPIQHLHHC